MMGTRASLQGPVCAIRARLLASFQRALARPHDIGAILFARDFSFHGA